MSTLTAQQKRWMDLGLLVFVRPGPVAVPSRPKEFTGRGSGWRANPAVTAAVEELLGQARLCWGDIERVARKHGVKNAAVRQRYMARRGLPLRRRDAA